METMQLRPAFRAIVINSLLVWREDTFCRLLRSEVDPAYGRGALASVTTWQTAVL
jgi:hypothetical protein